MPNQNTRDIRNGVLKFAGVADGPPLAQLAGLSLEGTKVAEVVMSAPRGDGIELLAVTALDARDRTLVTDNIALVVSGVRAP